MKRCYLIKELATNELARSKKLAGVNACETRCNYTPRNAAYKAKVLDYFIFFDKDRNIITKFSEGDFDCFDKHCVAFIEKHDSESICEYYDRSKYEFIEVDVDKMELQGVRK